MMSESEKNKISPFKMVDGKMVYAPSPKYYMLCAKKASENARCLKKHLGEAL